MAILCFESVQNAGPMPERTTYVPHVRVELKVELVVTHE